ncbi:unnamed protein product [Mytilus coruscus]|uniref:Uncharacterized protein n=1 Tax=Mytilus coruscus TaxID=42192 RepID=A0A6J8EMU4_MYTCO|nr:unnamed protein product [Mytilus coruscus]
MLTKLVLLSPRGSFTWMEAYDTCKASKGYLASEIGYNSTVDLPKSSSAWVGKVELASKWLQIIALGDRVEDKNIGWTNSLNECIAHYGTYFPDDFRQVCSYVGSPSSIIGGVVFGLIVLVIISIALANFKKRCVSICSLKSNTDVLEELSKNTSDEVGLDNNDDIENQTATKNEYSSSGNTINSTVKHSLDCENVQKSQHNIKKLQSGWKDENDTGEKGSDHIPVDEDGKVSGEQDHYQTSSYVATPLSKTLDGGSGFFFTAYTMHRIEKKSNASLDDSDFLGFSDS